MDPKNHHYYMKIENPKNVNKRGARKYLYCRLCKGHIFVLTSTSIPEVMAASATSGGPWLIRFYNIIDRIRRIRRIFRDDIPISNHSPNCIFRNHEYSCSEIRLLYSKCNLTITHADAKLVERLIAAPRYRYNMWFHE